MKPTKQKAYSRIVSGVKRGSKAKPVILPSVSLEGQVFIDAGIKLGNILNIEVKKKGQIILTNSGKKAKPKVQKKAKPKKVTKK